VHIDATILLELGLLLIVLTAMSGLAWRVGFTAAPLFLLVGLLLGEGSVVDFEESRGFLEVAAGLGVIMLLLTLGWSSRWVSSSSRCAAMRRPGWWTSP